MREELAFVEIWHIFKKHFWKTAVLIVGGMIAAYVFMMFLVTPQYESTMQLLINQTDADSTEIQLGNIQSSIQLINTYRDIIRGNSVLEKVNDDLEEDYSVGALRSAISVEQSPDSQAFDITVRMESPSEAQEVLQSVVSAFEDKVEEVYGMGVANINILSTPTLDPNQVSPNPLRYLALGGMLGLMLAIIIAFIQEISDTSLSEEDLRNKVGLISLGQINQLPSKQVKKAGLGAPVIVYSNPQSVHSEQFRTLRTNIEFAQIGEKLSSLLVTSSIPSEGKSTVAANLAVVMGQTDKKVLLVDADLRKPTLHKTFRLNNKQGLSTLIANPEMTHQEIIQRSQTVNISFLPSGPVPPNPAEMLTSARMVRVMNELSKDFDLVIYDAPPVNTVTDPQVLATRVDGVILVVRHGQIKSDEIKSAKYALDNVEANILGYVMNGLPRKKGSHYYTEYGYGQNYDEESDAEIDAKIGTQET